MLSINLSEKNILEAKYIIHRIKKSNVIDFFLFILGKNTLITIARIESCHNEKRNQYPKYPLNKTIKPPVTT